MTRQVKTNVWYNDFVKSMPELNEVVFAITGTTSGTGFWTVKTAIRKHVRVAILLNRASKKNDESFAKLLNDVEECGRVTQLISVNCDLMSFDSVKAASIEVNQICEKFGGLNVLANNAGIMMFPDKRTSDGYDIQMQTNFLSHALLTKLLMPSFLLAYESGREVRIVQHSALARHFSVVGHTANNFKKTEPGTLGGEKYAAAFERYRQTKLANVTFAQMLSKKLAEQNFNLERIKSLSAEPGICSSDLGENSLKNHGFFSKLFVSFFSRISEVFVFSIQSTPDGSLCLLEACFGKNVCAADHFRPEKLTIGKPLKVIAKGKFNAGKEKNERNSIDSKQHELVWTLTEEAIGPFFSTL